MMIAQQMNLSWILSVSMHLSYGFVLVPMATRSSTAICGTHKPGFENDDKDSFFAKLEEQLHEDTPEARMSLFNKRFSNIKLDRTEVGPSIVVPDQRGLFASCDCSKGDLLTCYPGDLLVVIPDEGDYELLTGEHVENKEFEDDEYDLSDELMGYLLHATDEFGVLGLPWLDDEPAYLGHFANDGAVMPTQAKDVDTYISESLAKANAKNEMISCHMVTIATRDISKGEEVLTSYGPDYWMDHSDFE
jgi:hypothetical protein